MVMRSLTSSLVRRLRLKKSKSATIMVKIAKPPMAPPTIAPTGVEGEDDVAVVIDVDDEVDVDEDEVLVDDEVVPFV